MKDREFQSVLLRDLAIGWPGFRIRRLALNRHMPRVEKFREHRHDFTQLLLYLRGGGTQWAGGEEIAVERGTLLHLPAGVRHCFVNDGRLRPVCLVIDCETEEDLPWSLSGQVDPSELGIVEQSLLGLHAMQRDSEPAVFRTASLVLAILSCLERAALGRVKSEWEGPQFARVAQVVRRIGFSGLTANQVATELGVTLDHLNRALRLESGFTVGRYLVRLRLEESCRLLRASALPVGEIASRVGIDDSNYFARWFRKETGMPPSRWRETMRDDRSGRD